MERFGRMEWFMCLGVVTETFGWVLRYKHLAVNINIKLLHFHNYHLPVQMLCKRVPAYPEGCRAGPACCREEQLVSS